MVGWHHELSGHESEQTQGDGDGQGSLAMLQFMGSKESDTTERLNNHLLHDKLELRQVWHLAPFVAALQCLYWATPLFMQQNTKELYGTENSCVQAQWDRF